MMNYSLVRMELKMKINIELLVNRGIIPTDNI